MTTIPDSLLRLEGYLRQDPSNPSLLAEAFDVALRSGCTERAASHLEAGLRTGAEPLAWGLRQAHLLMSQHDWRAAQAQLQALRDHPEAPAELRLSAIHDEAYVAMRQGDYARGVTLLAPVVEAEPSAPHPAIQALWLRLLHHADDIDKAMQFAASWSTADSLAAEATGAASLAAFDYGDFASSKTWGQQALARMPSNLDALVALGSIALAEQQPDHALALLDKAHRQHPGDGRALSARALAKMSKGDLATARPDFELALRYMPDHVGTWHGLGWLAILQGALAEAKDVFEKALALDRNFAESHGGLAVVLAKMGNRAGAQAGIERALRLDRTCMSAHYAQAVLDGNAQDVDAVQRLASRLMAMRNRPRSGA